MRQQGRPCPWRSSCLLPTDFWSVSLLRWQKPHCEDAPQRSNNTALPLKPSFPSALPRGASKAVGAQPQAHPPTCANIITWSKKMTLVTGDTLLATTVLALLLSSCSPPALPPSVLLLRWMQCPPSLQHGSQAVGITFCCPCTCFAFSRNLPGCQSHAVAALYSQGS